jgi:hypothetical protein
MRWAAGERNAGSFAGRFAGGITLWLVVILSPRYSGAIGMNTCAFVVLLSTGTFGIREHGWFSKNRLPMSQRKSDLGNPSIILR